MKLVASAIYISTSLMMFFINGIMKSFEGYYGPPHWLNSAAPILPWLTLIIGFYYFLSNLFQEDGEGSSNNKEQ